MLSKFVQISAARVVAAIGMFLLSVAIGQSFGADGLGEFTLWLSIAIMLGLISRLGLDGCLLKLVAIGNNTEKHYPLYSAYWRSVTWSFFSAIGSIVLLVAAVLVMTCSLSTVAIWMLLSVPGLTSLGIVAGYQRGKNNNTVVALIDVGGVGAVTFLALLTISPFGFGKNLEQIAMLFFILASTMAAIGIWLCARDISRRPHNKSIGDHRQREAFHKDQLHFAIVIVAGFLMQAGAFPLAAYSLDNETIGILRAAERLTTLIVFPTIAINLMLVSQISALLGGNRKEIISQLVQRNIWSCLLISAAMSIPLVVCPEFFLSLFGPEFVGAKNKLILFAIAQMVFATISPIISALSYSGQGRLATKITIQTAIFGIVSFPLLSYYFGGWGFVWAYLGVSIFKAALANPLRKITF